MVSDKTYWDVSLQKREQRDELCEAQNRKCWWCLLRFRSKRPPTIDHIIPLSCGGPIDRIENMVAACQKCNVERGDMMPEVFARLKGVVAPAITLPSRRGLPRRVGDTNRAAD